MPVRPALPADMHAIYLMGFDAWGEGADLSSYLNGCRSSQKYRRGSWYVLEEADGTIASSLILYRFDSGAVGFGSISTNPTRRRKGFASTLIRDVMESLRSESPDLTIFLYSDAKPEFYERLGFVALPIFLQQHPASLCMVSRPAYFASKADLGIPIPGYF